MKAIVYNEYGSPDVLHLEDVETPTPKDEEVLVKVEAASLNATDVEFLRGDFIVRMIGPRRPRYSIPGSDFAGRVEVVGGLVKQFRPGDEVFADLSGYGFGALAEYVCVPESALRPKTKSVSFEDAASVPQAGILALQGIRDKGQVKPDQKVLINGAGGGVGTFAIQIAKLYGAEVTGVDNAQKLEMLRSIGAHWVIDYTQEDITKSGKQFDTILDVVGHPSVLDYRRLLRPEGTYAMVGGSTTALLQAVFVGGVISLAGSKRIGILAGRQNKEEDLLHLLGLLESGKVVPVVDRTYPLADSAEAFQRLADGEALGKLVIVPGAGSGD